MDDAQTPVLNVSDFIAITNQALETIYPQVIVEGEVESFTVNQQKFVFFNLKDDQSSIGCFMMRFALHIPIEDGMRVRVRARAKLTQRGKFSLTIDAIRPVGEGSVKKSFELLRKKLAAEGLFDSERKRVLPWWPRRVAIISSEQAAGYADFMKIAQTRIKGVDFLLHQARVQGTEAPESLVRAIRHCNELPESPEVIVIVRGGGSADDLAAFNDERVVRAIAASRVPILTGVGHEVDTTLADLVADVRAATPTHAASLLLPQYEDVVQRITRPLALVRPRMAQSVAERQAYIAQQRHRAAWRCQSALATSKSELAALQRIIQSLDPRAVLERGYAILRGDPLQTDVPIMIETATHNITAKVISYDRK